MLGMMMKAERILVQSTLLIEGIGGQQKLCAII